MTATTVELPKYLLAKRKTLAEFRGRLADLPSAWKGKRIDAFVPSPGFYLDAWNNVRLEATSEIVYKLPGLSQDQSVVFFPEEAFDPADDAWQYLAKLAGYSTVFPGRGGTAASTMAAIDELMKKIDAKYGLKSVTVYSASWWTIGLMVGAAVLLFKPSWLKKLGGR
jgi:hypothetical protein